MKPLLIPESPETLRLRVERLWNGNPCPLPVWAEWAVGREKDHFVLCARGPVLDQAKIPDGPVGSRVANLWEYDVAELFLAGSKEHYLEIELGAGGQFLILSFDAIRHRSDEHETIDPELEFRKDETVWQSCLRLPLSIVPQPLQALNAFAIMAGQFLAFSPVPGLKPDFHQPESFPRASL